MSDLAKRPPDALALYRTERTLLRLVAVGAPGVDSGRFQAVDALVGEVPVADVLGALAAQEREARAAAPAARAKYLAKKRRENARAAARAKYLAKKRRENARAAERRRRGEGRVGGP